MKFLTKPYILENTDAITRPIFKLNELDKMNEKAINSLNTELKIPNDVLQSLKIKNELNPQIFKDNKLIPKIRIALTKLAKDFFDSLDVPPNVKMKDILFVGSLANYNWSKFSDIDLHIVMDFKDFKDDKDFIKKHFDAEKNLWNSKHNVKIDGFPVEIYIQDVKEKLYASAIYSVKSNKWIVEPDKTKLKIDKSLIKRKVQKIFDKIKDIKKDYEKKDFKKTIKKIDKIKELIKNMRKSGLEKGGEYSTENLVFKVLRRTDFMELLDSYKNKSYDNEISIKESMYGVNKDDKIIPYNEKPEFRAAAKAGVSNKDVISDSKFREVTIDIIQARQAANAFTRALKKRQTTFEAEFQGKLHIGRIPENMLNSIDINGKPMDWSRYFDIPSMGDGGFQVKLYKSGKIIVSNIRTNPNLEQPDLDAATDSGYNKIFDDRIKYFDLKAGVAGKFQNETKVYSVFETPAIDAAIKVRTLNHEEITNFLKPSKSYTTDKKGQEISNTKMDREHKISKIRFDAEELLNFPLAKSAFWVNWKKANLEMLSDEDFKNLDVRKAAELLASQYRRANPEKRKPELSITKTPEEIEADKAKAERYAKFLAQKNKR